MEYKELLQKKKTFKFAKYKSIEKPGSSALSKQLNQFQSALEKKGRNLNDIEFVLFEKIHGANFSFIIVEENGKKQFQACKRTGMIKENELFNQYEKILEKYRENLEKFYDILKELKGQENKKIKQIQVFGEIYGGSYKHKEVQFIEGVKHVQKGVYYCPQIEFQAFDCSVIFERFQENENQVKQEELKSEQNGNLQTKNEKQQKNKNQNGLKQDIQVKDGDSELEDGLDKEYLYMEDFLFLCQKSNVPYVEPIKRGKYSDLYQFDVEKFESEIYKRHNLPKIEHNIAEGVVMRPYKEFHGPLIKIKAEKFYEKAQGKKGTEEQIEKKQMENRENEKPKEKKSEDFIFDVKLFFTYNRLESVLSKLGDVQREKSPENQKKLVLLLIQDAVEDFCKENEENEKFYNEIKNNEQMSKIWKKFNQATSAGAFKVVSQYINEK